MHMLLCNTSRHADDIKLYTCSEGHKCISSLYSTNMLLVHLLPVPKIEDTACVKMCRSYVGLTNNLISFSVFILARPTLAKL